MLITTHVGLSTQRFIGFNCTDVCDSLLSDGSLEFRVVENNIYTCCMQCRL